MENLAITLEPFEGSQYLNTGDRPMDYQIQKRDMGLLVLFSVVTLGIYYVYLMAMWAKDINYLVRRERHNPILVVVLGVATCTLALLVWEAVYAYDLQKITSDRDVPDRNASLGSYVLILNIISMAVAFVSGGFAIILSVGLGIWALCLIQKELNLMSAIEERERQSA
jgi:hypothetical protein